FVGVPAFRLDSAAGEPPRTRRTIEIAAQRAEGRGPRRQQIDPNATPQAIVVPGDEPRHVHPRLHTWRKDVRPDADVTDNRGSLDPLSRLAACTRFHADAAPDDPRARPAIVQGGPPVRSARGAEEDDRVRNGRDGIEKAE